MLQFMEKHLLELKNRPKIEYLKSKSLGKKCNEFCVKWKGYDNSWNSWIMGYIYDYGKLTFSRTVQITLHESKN